MIHDGAFDILALVIILGVILAISMGLILPLVQTSNQDTLLALDNKTVTKTIGESIDGYGDYDGTMSKLEAVLSTQVYDWGNPEPRLLIVNGTEIEITTNYKNEMEQYAQEVWAQIKDDPEDSKYVYKYDYSKSTKGAYVLTTN